MNLSMQPIVDLLLFYREGNVALFNRCVDEWLRHEFYENNTTLASEELAWRLFNALVGLGIIEKYFEGATRWKMISPCSVKLRSGRCVLLHPKKIVNSCDSSEDVLVEIWIASSGKVSLSLSHASQDEAAKIGSVIESEAAHLVNSLPNQEIVAKECLVPTSLIDIDLGYMEFFEETADKWSGVVKMDRPGLYRAIYPNHSSRYVIYNDDVDRDNQEIIFKEWCFVAYWMMAGKRPRFEWRSVSEELYIKMKHFHRLPTIIQRALVGLAFQWPRYDRGDYVITNVRKDVMDTLERQCRWAEVSRK